MPRKIIPFVLALLLPFLANGADKNLITGFRTDDKSDSSRFVMESVKNPDYRIFILDNPTRVVIDVNNAELGGAASPNFESYRIKEVRYSDKPDGVLRIVLDVNQQVAVKNSFILKPANGDPYRLVIDLAPEDKQTGDIELPKPTSRTGDVVGIPVPTLRTPEKPMIVIDAGHGGHDPGTIGRKKTKEKDITLDYAIELRDELLKTGKYRVYLTRSSDKFIPLGTRVDKARMAKGDLFISIHANSHENNSTDGFSIYTLSENASDKEAMALAQKENKADIINGVDLGNSNDEISELLIDMVQRETKNLSASFAETVIDKVKGEAKILHNPHRFAGFRVLTGADIPSVLIELGYLTNKKEEKLLKSSRHRNRIAKALIEAIDAHFAKYGGR